MPLSLPRYTHMYTVPAIDYQPQMQVYNGMVGSSDQLVLMETAVPTSESHMSALLLGFSLTTS